MNRGTGGNLFIAEDAGTMELLLCIRDQLQTLEEFAVKTGKHLDLSKVTVETTRVKSGKISVEVAADLQIDGAAEKAAILGD